MVKYIVLVWKITLLYYLCVCHDILAPAAIKSKWTLWNYTLLQQSVIKSDTHDVLKLITHNYTIIIFQAVMEQTHETFTV